MFAVNNFDQEDLIRRFLDGMQVDLRGRYNMVTYTSLEDLVEKAAVQEACITEEQKFLKAAQPKSEKNAVTEEDMGSDWGTQLWALSSPPFWRVFLLLWLWAVWSCLKELSE